MFNTGNINLLLHVFFCLDIYECESGHATPKVRSYTAVRIRYIGKNKQFTIWHHVILILGGTDRRVVEKEKESVSLL